MTKERFKLFLKITLGALVIAYVLRSKMVDFSTLRAILVNPVNLIVAFSFLLLSALLCTVRWHLLVKAQGLSLSIGNLFSLTMIGAFFNTFMPGSVGGDLIKAWYVAGREKNRRTGAVLTVLLDRVIGLAVILIYAAVTLLVYTEWLDSHILLKPVALAVWGSASALILSALLFYSNRFWNLKLTQSLLKTLSRSSKLSKLIHASLVYQKRLPSFIATVGLSTVSILGLNILYILQGHQIGIEASTAAYFFIVPVAMVISAIPILPGGIGTGQVAFYHLFLWLGIPNPDLGGTLCTLVQIYTILFNCLGAIFYFRFKRDPSLNLNEKMDLNSSIALA